MVYNAPMYTLNRCRWQLLGAMGGLVNFAITVREAASEADSRSWQDRIAFRCQLTCELKGPCQVHTRLDRMPRYSVVIVQAPKSTHVSCWLWAESALLHIQ